MANQYTDGSGSLNKGVSKNYNGNTGLFGTLSDYIKVVTLHVTGGITQSGVRLINANDISNMHVPRVMSNELSNVAISALYGTENRSFSLGGTIWGPSHNTGMAEPTFQQADKTQGNTTIPNDTFWDNMYDSYAWQGAGGTWFIAIPSTKTVIAFASMDLLSVYQKIKLTKPIISLLNNDFSSPDNLIPHVPY